MSRYEITGCAADRWPAQTVAGALRRAGAMRVGQRNAFGRRNQPKVATFAADTPEQARELADSARRLLDPDTDLPALLPRLYKETGL